MKISFSRNHDGAALVLIDGKPVALAHECEGWAQLLVAEELRHFSEIAQLRYEMLEDLKGKPTAPVVPEGLHQDTADLVADFAEAMAEKLRAAELKYGYSNGWKTDDWEAECQLKLLEHLEKGDPRDVANYCAFLWARGWRTVSSKPTIDTHPCEAKPVVVNETGNVDDKLKDVRRLWIATLCMFGGFNHDKASEIVDGQLRIATATPTPGGE